MICPEFEYRNTLSDEDFWAYVFPNSDFPELTDYFDGPDLDDPTVLDTPCPVCHSTTACGYDSEGRAMIHVVEGEKEE